MTKKGFMVKSQANIFRFNQIRPRSDLIQFIFHEQASKLIEVIFKMIYGNSGREIAEIFLEFNLFTYF